MLRDCTTADLSARVRALRAELAALTTELNDRILGESKKARDHRLATLTTEEAGARLRRTEDADDGLPF